jgi:hypothetical protein
MVAKKACRKAQGRKRSELQQKVYRLSVRRNETETVQSKQFELDQARCEVK